MSIIKSLDRTDQRGLTLSLVNEDGSRETFDVRDYIRKLMADELGYAPDADIRGRLAHLRNDGGASL